MIHIATYITDSLQDLYSPEELRSLTTIICRDLLKLDMMLIYLRKDIKLSENECHLLEQVVLRLKNHEPIQYVRGTADFYGQVFHVAPGVLIPRLETEELIDLIVKENSNKCKILDIGTGSGCIAISLSLNMPQATVDAWDISPEALAMARRNNRELGANVIFYQRDVLTTDVSPQDKYTLIVSNPPYITEKEKILMEKNVLEWEPDIALFVPDEDPLRFYRRIALLGREMLTMQGRLYFEINQAYGDEVVQMLRAFDYQHVQVIKDLFNNDRIVTAWR